MDLLVPLCACLTALMVAGSFWGSSNLQITTYFLGVSRIKGLGKRGVEGKNTVAILHVFAKDLLQLIGMVMSMLALSISSLKSLYKLFKCSKQGRSGSCIQG